MSELKTLREKLAERIISGGALDEIVVVGLEDYLDTNLKELNHLLDRGLDNLKKYQWEDLQSSLEVSYALIRVLRDYSVCHGIRYENDIIFLNKLNDKINMWYV